MKHPIEALNHAFDLGRKGKYEEALRICDNYILNWPHSYMGYYKRANILSMMGRHKDAVLALTKVIALEPKQAFGYAIRADEYEHLENYAKAINDLTKAIELDNGYFGHDIRLRRAECHRKNGDFDSAIEDCKTIPDDYEAPGFRGALNGSKHMVLQDIHRARRTERGS